MKNSHKMLMAWCLFVVWALTVFLTILLKRDVAVLSIVSGVFGGVTSYFFTIREREKKTDLTNTKSGV